MYWRRFNLTGEPFSLTPDPAFLYLSSVHAEAYAAVTMGLKERRGLISMIGEVGTGKTTLVYSLLSNLGPEIHTAYISNARLSFDGILRNALRDFGVDCDELHGVQLLDAFNDFLHNCAKAGTTAALVIDEAQNLSSETFEDLRLLSNFETYKTKLLQIVLVGQPELDTKLRDPALRQVADRIAVRTHVNPLTSQEARHYIEHRLSAVGGSMNIFSEPAIRTITSRSAGIPRAINILCHNAMLFAYGQTKDKIARSMVLEAVHEKEGDGLVRLSGHSNSTHLPSLPSRTLNTPAWTWNAVFLILAVGLSIAMIRVAGNIRFAPAQALEPLVQKFQAAPEAPAAAPAIVARVAAPETVPVRRIAAPTVLATPSPAEPQRYDDERQAAAAVAEVDQAYEPIQVEPVALVAAAIAVPGHEQAQLQAPVPAEPQVLVPEEPKAIDAQPILSEPVTARPDDTLRIEGDTVAQDAHADENSLALLETDTAQLADSTYQIIDVEPGSSLSDLMITIYGHYTSTMVQHVQALNPQITNPNIILAGDALRFPSEWKLTRRTSEEVQR
jgi:type II secretory pathway predicted ATPase ExeA